MTITPTEVVVVVTLGVAVFVYRLFRPARPTEQPGPHNNWTRTDRDRAGFSFDESGAGTMGGEPGGHW